jgi:hypothetical protein
MALPGLDCFAGATGVNTAPSGLLLNLLRSSFERSADLTGHDSAINMVVRSVSAFRGKLMSTF